MLQVSKCEVRIFDLRETYLLCCFDSFILRENVFHSAALMMSVYNEKGDLSILVQACEGAAEIKSQCVLM